MNSIPPSGINTQPRCYIASSISTYTTKAYDRNLASIARLLPGYELVPARGMFSTSSHWLATWKPLILPTIDRLVFFLTPDRMIGRGVYTEICDCADSGKPVHLLYRNGLVPLDGLAFDLPNTNDWRRYARVSVMTHETERVS